MPITISYQLQQELDNFERNKLWPVLCAIISRIFLVAGIIFFVSLFLGLLSIFFFDDFGVVGYVGLSFFILVLGIIMFSIVRKEVKRLSDAYEISSLKNAKALNMVGGLLTFVVMLAGYYLGNNYLKGELNFLFAIKWALSVFGLLAIFLISSLFKYLENTFYTKYKQKVIPELIHAINPDFVYSPDKFIEQTAFDESQLFTYQTMYSYKGDSLVEGIVDDCLFQFCQLKAKVKNVKKSQGKTEIEIKEIFNGIFYVTNFNKSFKGRTVIVPDYARQILGFNFGEMVNEVLSQPGMQLVKFEDNEFEKKFAVYSTDQIEARYILSTSLVLKIRELQKRLNNEIRIAFIHNKLFLAVPYETDFLRPNIFRKINNRETIEIIYDKLQAFTDITHDMRLNVKIWGEVKL